MINLAVIGSRTFRDSASLWAELDSMRESIRCIVTGGAEGPDQMAELWAFAKNIPIIVIKPDWEKYGKSAGPIRNKDIIDNCDEVLAYWDGKSKGTQHALALARREEKTIHLRKFSAERAFLHGS